MIKNKIPNAITCLNVASGTLAILISLQLAEPVGGLTGIQWAWILIAIAATADFCDGLAARSLKAYSAMGKELDSLCDLVSFGVAPAAILSRCLSDYGAEPWLMWILPLIPVCGALRLARFNVSPENNDTFTGLPIPANAIFWIGFTAWYSDLQTLPLWIVLTSIVVMSWLMVSPFKLFTLKFKSLALKGNLHRWLLVVATVVFCCSLGVAGLMWSIIFYILLSLAIQKKIR